VGLRVWGALFASAVFWRTVRNGTRAAFPQHNRRSIAHYLPHININYWVLFSKLVRVPLREERSGPTPTRKRQRRFWGWSN
jgi:hypothetical protein